MGIGCVGGCAEANPLVTLCELDRKESDQSMNVIVSADLSKLINSSELKT